MEIVSNPRNQEYIQWICHGKAFMIKDRKKFISDVLPRYFFAEAKYTSFTRRLNRWRFKCYSTSPKSCVYYHPVSTIQPYPESFILVNSLSLSLFSVRILLMNNVSFLFQNRTFSVIALNYANKSKAVEIIQKEEERVLSREKEQKVKIKEFASLSTHCLALSIYVNIVFK